MRYVTAAKLGLILIATSLWAPGLTAAGFLIVPRSGSGLFYARSRKSALVTLHYKSLNRSAMNRIRKLATGRRITRASDDAAGLAVAEHLDAQARQALRGALNSRDYRSFLQVKGGALGTITTALQRIRLLAVRAGSPILNREDRASIQSEIQMHRLGIERTLKETQFNKINIFKQGRIAKGLNLDKLDVRKSVGGTVGAADAALKYVTMERARVGARSNRVFMRIKGQYYYFANARATESRIRDADIAWQSMHMRRDFVMFRLNVKLLKLRR